MTILKKGWAELLENRECGPCPDRKSEDHFEPDCEGCVVKVMIDTYHVNLTRIIDIIVEKGE